MCFSLSTASAVSMCSWGRTFSWTTSGATSEQTSVVFSLLDPLMSAEFLHSHDVVAYLEEVLDAIGDTRHCVDGL